MTMDIETFIGWRLVDLRLEIHPVERTVAGGTWWVACVHVPSGVLMGRFVVPAAQGGARPVVDERAAYDRVGGDYRRLSIEVDVATEELHARTVALRRELALRKRLWRRRPRGVRIPRIESPSTAPSRPGEESGGHGRP